MKDIQKMMKSPFGKKAMIIGVAIGGLLVVLFPQVASIFNKVADPLRKFVPQPAPAGE